MLAFFDRFRKDKWELAPANIPAGWDRDASWRGWESPGNFVVGESHYMEALTALTGPPCENGYLRPVTVTLIRDPANPYDGNAFRAEVEGRHVGHLARHLAAQLAPPLDACGCARFEVCGLLRGGSHRAPNVGVHVWLDRRLCPGPEIIQRDTAGRGVAWPPDDDERTPPHASSGARRSESIPARSGSGLGYLRGAHYTDYVEQVKALRRGGLDQEAEKLLLELVDATEDEARAESTGVAPWYYEQLAILYSKRKQKNEEIAILERFAAQPHAPGVAPSKLLQRLAKKKAARDRRAGD